MEKTTSTLKKIITLLGTFFLAYGIVIIIIIGTGHWFNYVFLFVGTILMDIAHEMAKIIKWFYGVFEDKKINKDKIIIAVVACLLCLCLVNFGIFEGKAIKFAHSKPSDDAEWVIVLGAKVKSGNVPSCEYAVRLQAAANYLSSQAEPAKLILTGAQGEDEPASEASIGLSYIEGLIKIGEDSDAVMSSSQIFLDEESTSTSENLEFARKLIEENGGSASDKVLIVSSAFHLYRTSVLAAELGYENTSFCGATGLQVLVPYYYVREYAAYVREHLPL